MLYYLVGGVAPLTAADISDHGSYNEGYFNEGILLQASVTHAPSVSLICAILITGWAGNRARVLYPGYCSIHIIRLLRLHQPVHPSMRNL